MTPMIAIHESPLGALTLVASGGALTGLYFEGHKRGGPPAEAATGACGALDEARRQLDDYFAGRRSRFELPLTLRGEGFRARVWAALQTIPFGASTTYGMLAASLGAPRAARAVGAAVGANPISIIVPCHRVLGAGGALTGFAGGEARKRFLLELEREDLLSSSGVLKSG